MQKIPFCKYQGAGNDFILIDNREGKQTYSGVDFIRNLCDRRFGIGADGLIFINYHKEFDFDMQFYNPDGTQSFCGNGARCAVAFYSFLTGRKGQFVFSAYDGKHSAYLLENGMVRLEMNDVTEIIEYSENSYELYTGSPHLIKFEHDIVSLDVKKEGSKIRYSDKYVEKGINVNFVQVILNNELSIRTYERGVEEETLACGTGITAAALAFAKSVKLSGSQRILVHSRGGALNVEFDIQENSFINIILEGPASYVFKGEIHM